MNNTHHPPTEDNAASTAPFEDDSSITLESLLHFHHEPTQDALLFVAKRTRSKRIVAEAAYQPDPLSRHSSDGWWATLRQDAFTPSASVGDHPGAYHPLYIAAVLSATPVERADTSARMLAGIRIPAIDFDTSDDVRRSMTLNGMRMTTEFIQKGSQRVLQLVCNRLQLGQRDIVHDIIVYVMRQIMDIRAEDRDARCVRADSIAAYLGLDAAKTRELLAPDRLVAARVAGAIGENAAGPVRRAIDVPQLVESQIALLQPELRHFRERESTLLWLLDEIIIPLKTPAAADTIAAG